MISVITICWNAEIIISKTIHSILSQKNETFEFILVDGDSKDKTVDIVKKIIHENNFAESRFTLISEKDKGVYDAMNKGASKAHGDFILFMNGGDQFYNENIIDYFEELISKIDADAYYGNTLMEFYEGRGILHDNEEVYRNPIMPFIHQSIIVKRKLLLTHPFDLSYKILADYDFFYWMRHCNFKFYYDPFIVSIYDAKEGISENNPYQIEIERDRITGRDTEKRYWIRKMKLCFSKGIIQPIKNYVPRWLLNIYFRRKKKYIQWIN